MTSNFYLHIPFCRQKCPYCKFALTPVFDEFKKKRYIEYLKKEIRGYFAIDITKNEAIQKNNKEPLKSAGLLTPLECRPATAETRSREYGSLWSHIVLESSQGQKPKTIYFGGGTPSVLSFDEVRDILDCFPERDKSCEITFECNPEDITTEYIVGLFLLGINRISLGVQSLNNETLSAIHRSDESTIFAALDSIRNAISQTGKAGVSINIDFILGLPYTRIGETLENIQRLHKDYPDITHTSVYILEKGLYPKSWKSHTLDDSLIQGEFMDIFDYFELIGWNHYEFSNWARPGYESLHNQSYWDHSNYRGFGLSAASYVDSKRCSNSDSFNGYYRGDIIGEELLSPEQVTIEELMFGLRTSRGYDIDNPYLDLNREKLCEFVLDRYLIQEKNTIKLTKTGIFLIDYIMSELIS